MTFEQHVKSLQTPFSPDEIGLFNHYFGDLPPGEVARQIMKNGHVSFLLPEGGVDPFIQRVSKILGRTVYRMTFVMGEDGLIHAIGAKSRFTAKQMGCYPFVMLRINP